MKIQVTMFLQNGNCIKREEGQDGEKRGQKSDRETEQRRGDFLPSVPVP